MWCLSEDIDQTGTHVEVLSRRMLDDSRDGFQNWSFMSVMSWGESPVGIWSLRIQDEVGSELNEGSVGYTELILHGTKRKPEHMRQLKDSSTG